MRGPRDRWSAQRSRIALKACLILGFAMLFGLVAACQPDTSVEDTPESASDATGGARPVEAATPASPDPGLQRQDGGSGSEDSSPPPGGDVPEGFEDTAQVEEDNARQGSSPQDGTADSPEAGESAEPADTALPKASSEPMEIDQVEVALIALAVDSADGADSDGQQGDGQHSDGQQNSPRGVTASAQTGSEIGCGDRVVLRKVPVDAEVTGPEEHLRLALDTLLRLKPGSVPSDTSHRLADSRLQVVRIEPMAQRPGSFRVELQGSLRLGGTCDTPRVRAQLSATGEALDGVSEVQFFLNGQPLDAVLSARGAS